MTLCVCVRACVRACVYIRPRASLELKKVKYIVPLTVEGL